MFTTSGRTITFPGFLRAYVEDRRRRGRRRGRRRREAAARADPRRGRSTAARARTRRAHDHAAGPLHRAVAGQGAGGARHRPPVHLRLDHADHPGPRLRLEEGAGARPVLDGVRGDRAAGADFARLVDYDFTASVEDDLDAIAERRRQQRIDWLSPVLLRRRHQGGEGSVSAVRRAEEAGRRHLERHRRPRRQLDAVVRRRRRCASGRRTGRTWSGCATASRSAPTCPRTSHPTS